MGYTQCPLLAVEEVLEAPAQLVHRSIEPVAIGEGISLLAQLVQQLFDPHHAQVEALELEAVAAHPLQRLLHVEALHQQVRQRVEGSVGDLGELALGAVPAAVYDRFHAFA